MRKAGFHAGGEAGVNDKLLPAGYVVGPDVAPVTLTVEGTRVTATVAP